MSSGNRRRAWKFVLFLLLTTCLFFLLLSEPFAGIVLDIYQHRGHQQLPSSMVSTSSHPLEQSSLNAQSSCFAKIGRSVPAGLDPNTKVILFWTKWFHSLDIPYVHDKMTACPQHKCFLTQDRRYLEASSAVVFHIRDDLNEHDLPPCRTPEQRYVFFLLEAPPLTMKNLKGKPWPGFFNLTWTYRRDSDVFNTYYMEKFQTTLWTNKSTATEFLTKKKDRAIIFNSHCTTHGRREDYIAELQRHFPVDVVGSCGTGAVSCRKDDQSCEKSLVASYKFYLAFENAYCKDYVTEKVMRPLQFESLPIVYGFANFSLFMPPNSYIDSANFSSPKRLADYLWKLARDPSEYAKYYQWKFNVNHTRITDKIAQPEVASTCQLCSLLHDENFGTKRYDDTHAWWVDRANCSVPPWIKP